VKQQTRFYCKDKRRTKPVSGYFGIYILVLNGPYETLRHLIKYIIDPADFTETSDKPCRL